jgi:hypothetical protein
LLQEGGKFVDRSSRFGLDSSNGWYHALYVEDVNGDGAPDIVAGNHGLNSRFKASRREPVSMYVNDFDQNGTIEQIITRFDAGKSYPFALRGDMLAQLPSLKKSYLHFRDYKEKTMADIYPSSIIGKSIRLDAYSFTTNVWINQEGKTFQPQPLPWQAQLFPTYAINGGDFDGDGKMDLLIGGNLARAKPETGFYEAGYGLLLKGTGSGQFLPVMTEHSGVHIVGEIRQLCKLRVGNKNIIAVARNNETLEYLTY